MVGRSPKSKSIFSFLPLLLSLLFLCQVCALPQPMCIGGGPNTFSVVNFPGTEIVYTDACTSGSGTCSVTPNPVYTFNFLKQNSAGSCLSKTQPYNDGNSLLWNSTSYLDLSIEINIVTQIPSNYGGFNSACYQPTYQPFDIPYFTIWKTSEGNPGWNPGSANQTRISVGYPRFLNYTSGFNQILNFKQHTGCQYNGLFREYAVPCDIRVQSVLPSWMLSCGVTIQIRLKVNDFMLDTIPEAYVAQLPQFVWNDGHNDRYPLAPQETQYNFTNPLPETNLTRLGVSLTGCTDSGSTNYKATGFPVLSLYGKGGSMYLEGFGSVIRTDAVRLDSYNNHGIVGSMNRSINYPFLGHVEVQCQLSSGFMQFRPSFCISDNTLGASGLGCYNNIILDLPYINVYSENNGYQLFSDFSIYLQPSQLGDTQGFYFTMGGVPNSIASGFGCCWSITLTADIPPIAGTTTIGSSVAVTNFPSLQQVKLQSDDIINLQHIVITSVLAPEAMNVNVKNTSLTTHYDSTGFDESGATHQKVITSGWEVPSPPTIKIDDSSSLPVTFPSNAAITIAGVSTSSPLHTVVDNTVPVQVTNVVTVTDNIGTNYSVAGYSIHLEPDGPATAYIEPYSQLPLGNTATSLYSFMQSSKENKQYFIFGIVVLITTAFINILTVYLVMIYVNKNFKRRWVNNHQF
jgi:hypothetical protein